MFAFGVVLYEMLTATKPFTGKSQASLFGAILKDEPQAVSRIQPLLPPMLDRVVTKCLAKSPDERWQTAKDLGDELKWIAQHPVDRQAVVPGASRRRAIGWAAAGALTAIAASVLVWRLTLTQPTAAPQRLTFLIPPPPGAKWGLAPIDPGPVASPDGRSIAFVSASAEGRRVWVPSIDAGSAHSLPGTQDANTATLFWSPDSRTVAYCAAGRLKTFEVSGSGRDERTVECFGGGGGGIGSWHASGGILMASRGGLLLVPAAGEVQRLTKSSSPQALHRFPSWLPDGRHFVFLSTSLARPETSGIFLGSLDGGEPRRLLTDSTRPVYVGRRKGSGALLFVRGATLIAQPFNETTLAIKGEAVALAEGIDIGFLVREGNYTASPTLLVYRSGSNTVPTQLTWVDRAGRRTGVVNAQPATIRAARLSPDGTAIAYHQYDHETGTNSVWLTDLVRGVPQLVRKTTHSENAPVWSPDGRSLAYQTNETGFFSTRVLTPANVAYRLLSSYRPFRLRSRG